MGQTIDNRYDIIKQIGEGGMGAVYLAEDTRLKRKVAIKRLQIIGKQSGLALFQQRFEREALAMAGFQHPNIVSVYDYGQDDEGIFLVLEYMPGGSLAQHLRKRHYSVEEALQVILPLAYALQTIHQRNRVHRDIKPSNILFDEYGNPKLADFGVVKLLEGEEGHTLTDTGAAVGTPAYMAPELIGGEVSPATDQYALGVVLYELVTGKKPFKGRTPMETLTMQKYEPLPDPRSIDSELPDWICEIIKTALAKQPTDRYADIQTFAAALHAGESSVLVEEEPTLIPEPQIPAEFIGQVEAVDEEETYDALNVHQIERSPSAPLENRPFEKKKFPVLIVIVAAIVLVGLLIGFGGKIFGGGEEITQVAEVPTKTETLATETLPEMPTMTKTIISTPTKIHTPTVIPLPTLGIGSTTIREKDGMEMVYVPEGEFIMGCEWYGNCQPIREIYLTGFWIDKYEVTTLQYSLCVNDGECAVPDLITSNTRTNYYGNEEFENYPVIYVDWYQAQAYCQWVGGSLPTEAQWEKAARGTDGRTYPWGEVEPSCEYANYVLEKTWYRVQSYCVGDTSIVGSYLSGTSPYGVMDMAGNVWEWVFDWYGNYSSYSDVNPSGPEDGGSRVLRGGAWIGSSDNNRTCFCWYSKPEYNYSHIGFRCAFPVVDQ